MKKIILSLLFVFAITLSTVSPAMATSTSAGNGVSEADGSESATMQTVLCNVLKFVTGGIGKTIASFIIIGVGLGFFTGKVSWGVLIGVTLGMSALFGAPAVVGAITGDSDFISACDGTSGSNTQP